jgi:peroxiredoxin
MNQENQTKMTTLLKPDISGTGQTQIVFRHREPVSYRAMRHRILRGLACFLVVAGVMFYLASASFAQVVSSGSDSKADDVYAADFVLKDLNGKDVKLSDYKGRTIFLNFMATWCKDCLASIPALKAIYSKYHEKGLVMISISIQETHGKVAAYSQKHKLPYPTLLDEDGTIGKKYGVGGVPVKILIDRNGRIICWNCRSLDNLLEKQFETTAQ